MYVCENENGLVGVWPSCACVIVCVWMAGWLDGIGGVGGLEGNDVTPAEKLLSTYTCMIAWQWIFSFFFPFFFFLALVLGRQARLS